MAAEITVAGYLNGETVEFTDEEIITLMISNTGDEDLTLALQEFNEAGFSVISPPASPVAPAASTTLVVKSLGIVPGIYTRTLKLTTNDPLATNFQLELEVTVASAVTVYTDRTKLNRRFGKLNIDRWADRDGDQDQNKIDLTIYEYCVDTSRMIDALLGTGFISKFSSTPRILENLAAEKVRMCLQYDVANLGEQLQIKMASEKKHWYVVIAGLRKGLIVPDEVSEFNSYTNAPHVYIED